MVVLLNIVLAVKAVREHPDPVVCYGAHDSALLKDYRRCPAEDRGQIGGVCSRPERDDLLA